MPRKKFRGTTENLNIINEKANYIGFTLGEVPKFLQDFEPLNYSVPKIYDDKTYKVYKYIPVSDVEIMITPTNRLESLEERYKLATPLFTYMKETTGDDLEKYANFLKMLNQTNIEDIEKIEKQQELMEESIPFEVKYSSNFKWQIFYSEYAKKYFMLVSTKESDNTELFYLLKEKIRENSDKRRKKKNIFVPISNEEYSENILKKSEIADLENYLYYFTKSWPSIYEVIDKNGKSSIHIVGQTPVYDNIKSKYKIVFDDRKEAIKIYKLIKALFILAYDLGEDYKFDIEIDDNGGLKFLFENKELNYEELPAFLNEQAKIKQEENVRIKIDTKRLKGEVADLQKQSEEQNAEYIKKERQIYAFLECKKTFFGKVKYFFTKKKKKLKDDEVLINRVNKERVKGILLNDQEKDKVYEEDAKLENKPYTVEDLLDICKDLSKNVKENKNTKLDLKALKNKVENLDRKIKNATQYIDEIESHKKSIFAFWKFANKDEVKALEEGSKNQENGVENLKKTFNYEDDIEDLASYIDKQQRTELNESEQNATFAANFVLEGVNLVSKKEILQSDEKKIAKILSNLKTEYKKNLDTIEKKDFDIFGNVSEDKTKIKKLKNVAHREIEKDKFKILEVDLNTTIQDFKNSLLKIRTVLKEESHKIKAPYDVSLYKVSNEKIDTDSFNKFNLNPEQVSNEINQIDNKEDIYLYKINVPEGTNIIFYSNIIFYENYNDTLPLGMDISQEALINLDLYNLNLKNSKEYNISVSKNEISEEIKKIKVYEFDLEEKKTKFNSVDRVITIVLDGFGVGQAPDASKYGDEGSDTLAGIYNNTKLNIPNMAKLGLYNIDEIKVGKKEEEPIGIYGKAKEKSDGKNSPVGHWEIAGFIKHPGFTTYPEAFPKDLIDKFVKEANLKGILANEVGSGTELLKKYGEEHIKTGYPIIYTSADSVFQIAAHEDVIPVEKLYDICRVARKILDNPEYNVGTVIARPFVGEKSINFKRTYNRKDFESETFGRTMLDVIHEESKDGGVISIGKIDDLFTGRGIDVSIRTQGNEDGIEKTIKAIKENTKGLIFTNLVDTDMLYGHRNDIEGYAKALEYFDSKIPEIMENMKDTDMLIITGDHGNDPSTPSTDHSREYIPILIYGKNLKQNVNLGIRSSFADISATILDLLNLSKLENGKSFKNKII